MKSNIKNLKIYGDVKNFVVKRATPIILAGAIITGCVYTAKGISKRNHFGNNNLTNIYYCLDIDEDVTTIDDNIRFQEEELGKTIDELDIEFINAYNTLDINRCNEILANLSEMIIKAQIADCYNINYYKIDNFTIFGFRDIVKYIDEYGVSFDYNDEHYMLKAKGYAEKICYMYRAASKNQLDYNRENGFNVDLKTAYNRLKSVLTDKLTNSNRSFKSHFYEKVEINGKEKEKKIRYDGSFNFNSDGDLKYVIRNNIDDFNNRGYFMTKDNIKIALHNQSAAEDNLNNQQNEEENVIISNEEENNLPKKTR